MNATYDDRIDGIATSAAIKAPVRAATTADITRSGEQTIDGIAVVTGDRVLVKNQTVTAENGIYVVDTSSWARADDFDGNRDAVEGTRVWIIEGTAHAEEEWNCTSTDPITIGIDAITWAQSPLQDAVDAAETAQAAAEAAVASVSLPVISGGDALKGLRVNVGETAYEFTAVFGTAAFLNVGTGADQVVQLNGSALLPAVDGSLLTGVVGEFHPGTLFGLVTSNAADALHDITVATGKCRDDADTENLVLASAITKQIDAGWSVGNNAGGLDTGAVAINETYAVYLIKRTDTDVVDALFSLSPTAPTMPGSYTISRRIGSVITDGSANILPFDQWGDRFTLNTPTLELTGGTAGVEQTLTLAGVPTGIRVLVEFQINAEQTSATQRHFRIYPMEGTDVVPDDTNATLAGSGDATNLLPNSTFVNVMTDTSARVHYRITVSTNLWVNSLAWHDARGQY